MEWVRSGVFVGDVKVKAEAAKITCRRLDAVTCRFQQSDWSMR